MPAKSGERPPRIRTAALVLLAFLAGACGGGMSDLYANASIGSLDFQRDGTVYVTLYGGTFEGAYEVDGERVIVRGPAGAQVFQKTGDRLEGGFGMTFSKKTRASAAR